MRALLQALLAGIAADSMGEHEAASGWYEQSWRNDSADEATACRAALRINLAAGDYVEACYPYMARSPAVNAAAYAGAAMAGAVLLEAGGPRGTAYLPLPLVVLPSASPAVVVAAATAMEAVAVMKAAVVTTAQEAVAPRGRLCRLACETQTS